MLSIKELCCDDSVQDERTSCVSLPSIYSQTEKSLSRARFTLVLNVHDFRRKNG